MALTKISGEVLQQPINIGVVTATNIDVSGLSTFSGNLDINAAIDVDGHTELDELRVTGLSTFTTGPVLIGSGTSTGTVSQRLQVTGGAYVSGNLGIGTTNPSDLLDIYSNNPALRFTDTDDGSYSRLRYNRTGSADNLILEVDALNQNPDIASVSFRIGGLTSGDEKAAVSAPYPLTVGFGGTIITATSSGLVGVGVTNPVTKFQVGSATSQSVFITSTGLVGLGSTAPRVSLDASRETDAIALPQGTTAQRPTGNNPYIRYNTTNSALEFYNGTDWVEIISDYFPSGSVILG